jgi:23S rRNA pseudouridine2605 synthase
MRLPSGHGLARTLSKLGYCSRSQAWELISAGRVTVNGRVILDPEHRISSSSARLEVDGQPVEGARPIYVMLNKPRGLITTAVDERGRDTIFECFKSANLAHLGAVGRLDQASEGLLLLTNDTEWANGITSPDAKIEKTYHVQVDRIADGPFLTRITTGVVDAGETLAVRSARLLRAGERNSWIEIVLDEGKNRHIRRLMKTLGTDVIRLIRIAIGRLELGPLPKGHWRHLTAAEVTMLKAPATR